MAPSTALDVFEEVEAGALRSVLRLMLGVDSDLRSAATQALAAHFRLLTPHPASQVEDRHYNYALSLNNGSDVKNRSASSWSAVQFSSREQVLELQSGILDVSRPYRDLRTTAGTVV
jgi:hypothetical protein